MWVWTGSPEYISHIGSLFVIVRGLVDTVFKPLEVKTRTRIEICNSHLLYWHVYERVETGQWTLKTKPELQALKCNSREEENALGWTVKRNENIERTESWNYIGQVFRYGKLIQQVDNTKRHDFLNVKEIWLRIKEPRTTFKETFLDIEDRNG
jgi:hypothetical protein